MADFATLANRASQQLSVPEDKTLQTTADVATLTFSYDAETRLYTVAGRSESASFGDADFLGYDGEGNARYARADDKTTELLTLFNPEVMASGTSHVNIGLWQRRTPNTTDITDLDVDVFVYGMPTSASSVPTTGSASYDVALFGVATTLGEFPYSVRGKGAFSLDFAKGLFSASGEATEIHNDAENYYTCCQNWEGAGYLASDGGLSGVFTYASRYRASLTGALYGPSGSEIGGTLLGESQTGATFVGAFAGTRERDGLEDLVHVLGDGPRSFYTFQADNVTTQRPEHVGSSGSGAYFPGIAGGVDFQADRSITYRPLISNQQYTDVTFTQNDWVASRSDNRVDAYELETPNGNYQLELYRPDNPEIDLTFSSFGRWQEVRQLEVGRQTTSVWFTYGVPIRFGTAPTSGTARYSATILGSGERFADAEPLNVSGQSSLLLNFSAMELAGSLDAVVKTRSNETIDIPTLTLFNGTFDGVSFEAFLMVSRSLANGFLRGNLYGPEGEEIGGSFEFFTRGADGQADASYSAVLYGKRD